MSKVSRTRLAISFVRLLDKHPRSQLVKALALAVIEQRLTNEIDLLMRDINRELFKRHGQVEVTLISAHQLSNEILTQLRHYLSQRTHARHIQFHTQVDKRLLGGLIANTPGTEIDLSVRGKLQRLGAQNA